MTSLLDSIEVSYLSASGIELWLTRRFLYFLSAEAVFDVGVWLAVLRYFLFCSRSVVAGCSSVRGVEQLFRRP